MFKKFWVTGLVAFALAVPVGVIGASAADDASGGKVFVGSDKGESVNPPDNLVPDPTFPEDKTPIMSPEAAEEQARAVKEAEERGPSSGYAILPAHIDQLFIDRGCGPGEDVLQGQGADALDCEAYGLINDGRLEPGTYATREDLQAAVGQAEKR